MSGKVKEEVGQVVIDGMGTGSEAQVEQAWRGRVGTWPGCLLLRGLYIPAGGWVERLLFLDGWQRLWEGGGMTAGFQDCTPITNGSPAHQPGLLGHAGV